MTNDKDGKHLKLWAPAMYHIEVEGVVSEYWSEVFCDMRISTRTRKDNSMVTKLIGRVRDQAELSGLLNNLYECHLPILSVDLIEDNDNNQSG